MAVFVHLDTATREYPTSSKCDELKRKLEELTEENRKLVSQVSTSNKRIVHMHLQVSGWTSARDALQKQNADLAQDLLKLTEVKTTLEFQLRDAEERHRKELHDQQAKMEAQMKEVQNQRELRHQGQLHSQLTKFQVEGAIYERKISYLQARVSSLQHRESAYQEELVETRVQLDNCLANFFDVQQANYHLNDILQQQQTAYEETFHELAECEETIEKMRVFHAVRMEAKEEQILKLKLQVNEVTASETNASAEVTPNYYKLLGVNRQTTEKGLKKAYFAKSKEHHPDRVTHPDDRKKSEATFKMVKRAYDMLSDPNLKKVYNTWFDQTVINTAYQQVYCNRTTCN